MTNTLTVSSHDELISLISHTLGFTPESSMVCLAFGGGPTARLDLPDSREQMGQWLETLTDVYLHRHHPPRVALVAFGENGGACIEVLSALSRALVDGDVPGPEVGPVLWVNGDQWSDLLDGTHGTVDPGARARIDAEFALMGRVMPARGRDQLAAAMQGEPNAVAEHLPTAEARARELDGTARRSEVEWLGARLIQFSRDREFLSDAEAARVLAALNDTGARDAAALSMSREDAPVLSEFWQDLVRRAPVEVRDTPATLLGLSSFLEGHGAKAWVALDQLSERDRLADLVAMALEQAVDPGTWDQAKPAAAAALMQQTALCDTSPPGHHPDHPTHQTPRIQTFDPDAPAPGR